jgi:hypothetical protein
MMSFFGIGQLAPLWHAGSADGTGVAQDEHGVLGHVEIMSSMQAFSAG